MLLLNECNMQNVITSHKCITDHSKNLIALAITGNPSKITNSGAHATGISDYDFIHISINLFRKKVIKGLHKVIKCSFLSGKFPTVWKKARVTAVYNKSSKKSCSNYRPISLISIPSKVVEYLICSQINDHLTTFYLQNKHQWGFRNKRSNEGILLYMTEKWWSAIDAGKWVGVIFIDFKKIVDSVSHPVLLKKLNACSQFHQYIETDHTSCNLDLFADAQQHTLFKTLLMKYLLIYKTMQVR